MRFKNYLLIEQIGKGAQGTVSLYNDKRLGREVAIKSLNKNLINNSMQEGRFVDEDKIKNIQDSDNNDAFTEAEKAALSFVDHMMIDASNIPNKVADNFKNHFTPKQMVEIALTATVMVSLNLFNDAFRVPIEDEVVGVGLDVPEL